MPDAPVTVPTPTPDQRRIALDSFAKAREAAVHTQYDYAITLLLTCCKLDPGNFFYRQTLRKTQKDKFGNNLRGSRLAFLTTPRFKARVKAAKRSGDYLRVLEHAEQVLCRNPWDLGTQLDMAAAFEALGLVDLAVFTLDQARQKYPRDATLNRALARVFEKRGDFQKAMALWQLVRETHPHDVEAAHKAKDLAARDTIARGKYEQTAAAGSDESPALDRIEARAVEKQDKLARDVDPLRKRIEAAPTEPALYVQLAAVYRRHNLPDRARAVLQQGLGPTGNAFQLQLELMDLDLAPVRKNLEQAEARLRRVREKGPDGDGDEELSEKDLVQLRAQLLREVNSREIEVYRVKADRFPGEPQHRIDLGTRLLKADLVDEAIAELQLARRDEKLKWKAALYLGACFKKRSNWRLAQRNFEEALAANPKPDEATRKETLFHLATGCADNGDLPRAVDVGHELANLDFGFQGIGKLLDEWEKKLQKV